MTQAAGIFVIMIVALCAMFASPVLYLDIWISLEPLTFQAEHCRVRVKPLGVS